MLGQARRRSGCGACAPLAATYQPGLTQGVNRGSDVFPGSASPAFDDPSRCATRRRPQRRREETLAVIR